ncbi:drug/metabolite transporter permease [Klebsiella pneumoniae]|uniref:Drug/metabolite transporter permease n=1 Tax=Klebsiella pneumoniae TaxID=573 RepID=A0A2X1QGV3_KLEPN|nr:drug/metabolite transporter permease [Klebsiella pneumoniae]
MTRKDGLLALLVVVVWGLNFVVIKLGLHNMPPLMLAGLRFMLVAFPALLFVARPAIPLRLLLGYGLTISFGQFAFLFCAIGLGMPAGLASLVLQAQAFFTIILGAFVFGERLQGKQLAGIALAIFGVLVLVEGSLGGEHVPLVGFMLTLAAALSWACGNIFNKKIMSQASPAANHVAGGLERADPGAAVYAGLIVDRWPADHAGESATHRSANDTVAALSGVYRHYRRLWHLGIAAGAV